MGDHHAQTLPRHPKNRIGRTGSRYVAAGRLDGFWEFGPKPWDMAAGKLLITEAGGLISTKKDIHTNGVIHALLVEIQWYKKDS